MSMSAEEQRERARQWAEANLNLETKTKTKKRPAPSSPTTSQKPGGKKIRGPVPEVKVHQGVAATAPAQSVRQGPFSAANQIPPTSAGHPGRSPEKSQRSDSDKESRVEDVASSRSAPPGGKKKMKKSTAADTIARTSTSPSVTATTTSPDNRRVERRVQPLQVNTARRADQATAGTSIPPDDVSPQDAALFSFQPSAVLPALPPGLVPLVGAWLCMSGASVFAYVVWMVAGHPAAGKQLALGARMDAAVAALDVIGHRLLGGDFDALWSLTDPNLRLLGMLYGAVVCVCVGGLLINADPSSFHVPPLPERVQELMNLAMRQVSSINGIACEERASAAVPARPAPRLAFSVSGMVLAIGRGVRWLLRWVVPSWLVGKESNGRAGGSGAKAGRGAGSGSGSGSGAEAGSGARTKRGSRSEVPSESALASFSSLLSSPRDQFNGMLSSAREQGKQRLQTVTLWLSSRRSRSWSVVDWLDMGAGAAVLLAVLFWGLLRAGTYGVNHGDDENDDEKTMKRR